MPSMQAMPAGCIDKDNEEKSHKLPMTCAQDNAM